MIAALSPTKEKYFLTLVFFEILFFYTLVPVPCMTLLPAWTHFIENIVKNSLCFPGIYLALPWIIIYPLFSAGPSETNIVTFLLSLPYIYFLSIFIVYFTKKITPNMGQNILDTLSILKITRRRNIIFTLLSLFALVYAGIVYGYEGSFEIPEISLLFYPLQAVYDSYWPRKYIELTMIIWFIYTLLIDYIFSRINPQKTRDEVNITSPEIIE